MQALQTSMPAPITRGRLCRSASAPSNTAMTPIAQHPYRADEKAVLRIVDRQFAGDLRCEAKQNISVHLR